MSFGIEYPRFNMALDEHGCLSFNNDTQHIHLFLNKSDYVQLKDLVVAFLGPNSRGTKNMIAQAEKAGVKTIVIDVQ